MSPDQPGSSGLPPSITYPQEEVCVGVIADTHIPDRVIDLHPDILPAFRDAQVSHILHAGDVSTKRVLATLRSIAPVTAVRGNRDFFAGQLKMIEYLNLGGVQVALMHGHGGWLPYLADKARFLLAGYRLSRYLSLLTQESQAAKVVIFGHTHHPEIYWQEGKLIFNPGSASFGFHPGEPPSIGLLHLTPGQAPRAEIITLRNLEIHNRQWVQV